MTHSEKKLPVDLLTVFGIALLVVSLNVTKHEAVHALTCFVTGGTMLEFSAQHIHCASLSVTAGKWVSASSAIVDLLIGIGLYRWLQKPRGVDAPTKFAIWLFTLASLTGGAGYLAFSGIIGIGDYANVIEGWQPEWLWRTLMSIVGLILFTLCVAAALKLVGQFIGGTDKKEQVGRLQRVGMTAYVGSIVPAVAAGFFNEYGITGLPAVAGIVAVLGAGSPLLWMAQWFQADMFEKRSSITNLTFERSWTYIIAGLIAVSLYAFVLGPGIKF
ncbi:MAG: hypothetical protein ACPG8W_23110 [Candidatus Promineifilaceae bacterium]